MAPVLEMSADVDYCENDEKRVTGMATCANDASRHS